MAHGFLLLLLILSLDFEIFENFVRPVALSDSVRQFAVREFPDQPEQKELQLQAKTSPETVPDEMPDHISLVTAQTIPIATTKTNISKLIFSHLYLLVCPIARLRNLCRKLLFPCGQ